MFLDTVYISTLQAVNILSVVIDDEMYVQCTRKNVLPAMSSQRGVCLLTSPYTTLYPDDPSVPGVASS